jgi:lauroyl/myristoyl acyltransferase
VHRVSVMTVSSDQLRRAVTQLAIRQAIAATARLPISSQCRTVRSLVALAGNIPMLRWKVRENMRLALGAEVPAQAEKRYFRQLGWSLSNALATFHRGVGMTPVLDEVRFDDSVRFLDDAVAEGRGVVIALPHWSGHELVGAAINRRHPLTMLVRQASTPERMARKLKWYDALGVEIVLRPNHASTIKDAVAYLRILKSGKLLGITLDHLAGPGQGVETRVFGRPARLQGGAIAIAISARAPLIYLSLRWQADSSVVAAFEPAPIAFDGGDRDVATRAGLQDWCRWFEGKLRESPENWLFWLDKRWSRFLRATARTPGAQ